MTEISVADQMKLCTIVNGYDGLENLEQLARENPEAAWQIIWDVLTTKEDPGKDDGALCLELLKMAANHLGREVVEARILYEWSQFSDEIRRNMIYGFASDNVISIKIAINAIDHPDSTVNQRHLIVAMLASCQRKESPEVILELASRIGKYADNYRQEILESFLKSITNGYYS